MLVPPPAQHLFQRRIARFGQDDLEMDILIAALAASLVNQPSAAKAEG
jgi:hypothetical protein